MIIMYDQVTNSWAYSVEEEFDNIKHYIYSYTTAIIPGEYPSQIKYQSNITLQNLI